MVESTENKMNKTLVIAGTTILAASVFGLSAPAPAHAKGMKIGGGHHHHRHWHRPIIVTPVYVERRVVKPVPLVRPKPVATVRYADGLGRVYDPASGVWHDGQNHCWAGKSPWTFKSGSWFYGSNRWYPSNGTWLTNAAEVPAPIDCKSSPAFAAKADSQKELGGYAHQGESTEPGRAPIASAKVEPAGPQTTDAASGACKQYFPNLGEMLPVPCTN
jgi:hypothetical protein